MPKTFLDIKKILSTLRLRDDMKIADFGCGSGGWVLAILSMINDSTIYAIDILDEPLSALEGKLKMHHFSSNIITLKKNVEEGTGLKDDYFDLVLLTNLLFQIDDKKKVFEEARRVLKKGGKILVVDYKEDSKIGPEVKVSSKEIKELADSLDLKLFKEFEAGDNHFGLILRKA